MAGGGNGLRFFYVTENGVSCYIKNRRRSTPRKEK